MINFFSISLPGKVFIYLSFHKKCFISYMFLGGCFFPPRNLSTVMPCITKFLAVTEGTNNGGSTIIRFLIYLYIFLCLDKQILLCYHGLQYLLQLFWDHWGVAFSGRNPLWPVATLPKFVSYMWKE